MSLQEAYNRVKQACDDHVQPTRRPEGSGDQEDWPVYARKADLRELLTAVHALLHPGEAVCKCPDECSCRRK